MKKRLLIFISVITLTTYAQNITVDSATYTPQQLIEDILIDSDCITNVTVTNVVGGDFNNVDQSYGYFDATGTSFPFQSGIVLSTGRLVNVPGPNNSLSDDNAPNWTGDTDLEIALNESNTFNATILEFDFTAIASQVSFRYLFASEEYQENIASSCEFSDLFGFLIRPTAGQNQYENIALVPDTTTPVKVTTVTPGIPGSCPPQNEIYFGNYNGSNSPINFNGQTAVLTATANVQPNQSYHVKLVIADEQNHRYDSAVFLEAGSFQLSTDLGPDRLIATGNPLCGDETLTLDAFQQGASYIWYKDGVAQNATPCTNCGTFDVTEAGTYNVEVFLNNTCISYGDVVIEYAPVPVGQNAILIECDVDTDGLTLFNLFDAENDLTNNDANLAIQDFFFTQNEAQTNTNPIANPSSFQNSIPFETVYARVINAANCFDVVALELQTSNNSINIENITACDSNFDGFATFNLNTIEASIVNQIPTAAQVSYYETEADAFNETNALPNNYDNTVSDVQTIFVKIKTNSQCFSVSTANLVVIYPPVLEADETLLYCTNTFPETMTLFGGVSNDLPNNYYYQWLFNGQLTDVDTSFFEANEAGTYTVIATSTNGCSSSRTITVTPSNSATIESVTIDGISPNNSVTVSVSGTGVYDYAIDDSNGFYQESNTFFNVSEGEHTIYVRDRNGCGIVEETIYVIGFPKFFTPNGDEENDTWQVVGTHSTAIEIRTITIFNRYGKLITQLTETNTAWDGSFKGEKLPSDDYWYVAKLTNGKTYTGHFALRR